MGSDMIRTHPVDVLKTSLSSGVGTALTTRFGGTKIETIRNPDINPANKYSTDSILIVCLRDSSV
jgi:hypothetical protein